MLESVELQRLAKQYAEKGLDLYDLLSVDTTTSAADIHRAWRRKGLQYHPDKAGANFDAEKYELFERARDVLTDEGARTTYDNILAAAARQRIERDALNASARRMRDELEAAEAEGRRRAAADEERKAEMERERLRQADQMRQEVEDREKARKEAWEQQRREKEDERYKAWKVEDERLSAREANLQRQIDEKKRLKKLARRKSKHDGAFASTPMDMTMDTETKGNLENKPTQSETHSSSTTEPKIIAMQIQVAQLQAQEKAKLEKMRESQPEAPSSIQIDLPVLPSKDAMPTSGPSSWRITMAQFRAAQQIREEQSRLQTIT